MKRILLTSALVILCAPSLLLADNAPAASNQQMVSGPGTATATATTGPAPAASATASGSTPTFNIPSKDFLSQVAAIMVSKSCDPQSPLLTNFKITSQDCQSKVTDAESTCTNQILPKMPAAITSADMAAQWGQEFGKCVGQIFAKSLNLPGSTAPAASGPNVDPTSATAPANAPAPATTTPAAGH